MRGFTVLILAFLVSSCASVNVQRPDSVVGIEGDQTAPVQIQVPGGPDSAEPTSKKVVNKGRGVRSRKLTKTAKYQQKGHVPNVVIPPSENITPGRSGTGGSGIPASENFDPEAGTPSIQSWVDSSTSFLSINFLQNALTTGFYNIPPDSHAAAGPLHVVNVANTTVSIHLKSDGSLVERFSLKDFFAPTNSPPFTQTFDPKVLYDQYAGRWLIVTLERTSIAGGAPADVSKIFIAVSDNANPADNWSFMSIDSNTLISGDLHWADYPGFAVGEDAIYVTANMFSHNTLSNGGVRLWIVEKGLGAGGFYEGGTALYSLHEPYAGGGSATTTQPAHMYGAVPGEADTFLVSYSGLTTGINDYVQTVIVKNPLSISPTFVQSYHLVGNIDNTAMALPDAPQLGTSILVEVNDRRALDAVWIDDSLWFTATVLPPAGGNLGETTAYWFKLDTSDGPALADQGSIGGQNIPTDAYTFFPSVAVNGYGDVTFGFSASGSDIYAGAYFTTRDDADSSGVTGPSQVVKEGEDYYLRTFGGSRNRWGDYSGTAVDPLDGCFWIYNQYAWTRGSPTSGEDGRWGTAYAKTCNMDHACNASVDIPPGEWTRFSLPCNISSATVQDVFSGLDSGQYGNRWVMYRFKATDPVAYEELTLTDTLQVGEGYWLFTFDPVTVDVSGTINSLNAISLVGHVSEGRENYIGHNQDASVPWSSVWFVDEAAATPADTLLTLTEAADNAGLVSRNLNKWNGAAYQVINGIPPQDGELDPFDGAWVRAFGPSMKLIIPQAEPVAVTSMSSVVLPSEQGLALEMGTASDSAGTTAKTKPKRQPWHIQLKATSGDKHDPGNHFGRIPGGEDDNDLHDLEEPWPFGASYLTVLFENPDLDEVDWGYTSEFRPVKNKPGGTWNVVVKASEDTGEVTLQWDGHEFAFEDAWLTDEETGESMKVHNGESYTFAISGGEHRFTFEIN